MIGSVNTGGLKIRGIIEEYKVAAGEKIKAGDFVKFVNNLEAGIDQQLTDIHAKYDMAISATELEENKAFVVCGVAGASYAMICEMNNDDIIVSTPFKFVASGGYATSVIKLNANKVLIIHTNGRPLYGTLCNIVGSNIEVIISTQLNNLTYELSKVKSILLDSTHVFILCSYVTNSSYGQQDAIGILCTINGDEITINHQIGLGNGTFTGFGISISKLSSNKLFLTTSTMVNTGTNNYLDGVICTIEESQIKVGTYIRLSSSTNSGYNVEAFLLDSKRAAIVHSNGSSYYLYCMVCKIENDNISVINDTFLSMGDYVGYEFSATFLNPNQILIAHSIGETPRALNGTLFSINGNVISAGKDIILSTSKSAKICISTVSLNKKILVLHNLLDSFSYYYLWGMIIPNCGGVGVTDCIDGSIIGVAKNKGNEGDLVKVYVPEIKEEREEI